MKIEFIKEEKVGEKTTYYTQIDGRYVSGSIKVDQHEAHEIYKGVVMAVQSKQEDKKTVLESIEIQEEKPF